MSASEDQARKEAASFIKEAQGHLNSKSGFFGLFSSGPDYYEAIEAYNRAGNIFKAAKLCKSSYICVFCSLMYFCFHNKIVFREGSW